MLLLRRLFKRMRAGSALLIGEMLLHGGGSDDPGPVNALMQDLSMLTQTMGRERDLEGYRALLGRAGFSEDKVHGRVTSAYLDAVIAYY